MASIIICDRCGKEIRSGFSWTKITATDIESQRVKSVVDLHNNCYSMFQRWLEGEKERFDSLPKFKDKV